MSTPERELALEFANHTGTVERRAEIFEAKLIAVLCAAESRATDEFIKAAASHINKLLGIESNVALLRWEQLENHIKEQREQVVAATLEQAVNAVNAWHRAKWTYPAGRQLSQDEVHDLLNCVAGDIEIMQKNPADPHYSKRVRLEAKIEAFEQCRISAEYEDGRICDEALSHDQLEDVATRLHDRFQDLKLLAERELAVLRQLERRDGE